MLTWGEGWHNNHHAHRQAVRHGLAWYELDVNWYGIWTLSKLGLAWDLKLPKAQGLHNDGRTHTSPSPDPGFHGSFGQTPKA